MGWISGKQFNRDHNGLRNNCGACGHEGTDANPLKLDDEGDRVHESHFNEPNNGLYGKQQR